MTVVAQTMPASAGSCISAMAGASSSPASRTSPRRSATYTSTITGTMMAATVRNMRVARRRMVFR